MGNTYDAYVHIFFASHYAEGWFETWNYKWYTGFTMTSYPPLVHQIIALLSKVLSLKLGFLVWALFAVTLFIRGIFHFSRIWVPELAAGYACLIATFSSSYIEAMHIFGQLPSLTGIALLLNACPELYKWIRYGKGSYFLTGISILACLTVAHHVTTIFGMVFFVAPVLAVALLDKAIDNKGHIDKVRMKDFINQIYKHIPHAILIGITTLVTIIGMMFPYWYWSKSDPITQVSIPHGSRASFIEEPSLGLVFFLIPWGIYLMFLPGLLTKIFQKRNLVLGLSFSLMFLLGTGGTTPLPKIILGENAFNILTLDRFTFWASIMAIPFMGQLMYSLVEGQLGCSLLKKGGQLVHKGAIIFCIASLLFIAALVMNFSNYKPLQPDPIEVQPIVDFLDRDGHDRWRYMTLGFGDQMAWLSANTAALSVDGNYHSARRLPELTTRAVERIENSKYLGEEALCALRDFLSLPEKYHLKYVFSNDKFYEPLLYFYGWKKLQPLENNIDIWERKDVPPLPTILPRKNIPAIQSLMWGILPIGSLIFAVFFNGAIWFVRKDDRISMISTDQNTKSNSTWYGVYLIWFALLLSIAAYYAYHIVISKDKQRDPEELLYSYYHYQDFKRFDDAFELLDKSTGLTKEQYQLELSLEDGILASYAKLDSVELSRMKEISPTKRVYDVKAHWNTAVQKYTTKHRHELIHKNGSWYMKKAEFEKATPPDQLINIPDIAFLNQGRRKAEAYGTHREDVLDRPEIFITTANLVHHQDHYHIVGEIYNIDNDPAYISIAAVLYDEHGNEVVRANADEILIHNLLPKESSLFRIDFDENLKVPDTLGAPIIKNFVVFARSMVTDETMYKFTGIRELYLGKRTLSGYYDNYGNKEISIPQVLSGFSNGQNLLWVDATYLSRGIRPQREKQFKIKIPEIENIDLIVEAQADNLLVNGTLNNKILKLLPESDLSLQWDLEKNGYEIKLMTNGLIAN